MHMLYLFYTLLLALALGVLARPVDRALAGPCALPAHRRPANAHRQSSGGDGTTCASARTSGAATTLGRLGHLLGRLCRLLTVAALAAARATLRAALSAASFSFSSILAAIILR